MASENSIFGINGEDLGTWRVVFAVQKPEEWLEESNYFFGIAGPLVHGSFDEYRTCGVYDCRGPHTSFRCNKGLITTAAEFGFVCDDPISGYRFDYKNKESKHLHYKEIIEFKDFLEQEKAETFVNNVAKGTDFWGNFNTHAPSEPERE